MATPNNINDLSLFAKRTENSQLTREDSRLERPLRQRSEQGDSSVFEVRRVLSSTADAKDRGENDDRKLGLADPSAMILRTSPTETADTALPLPPLPQRRRSISRPGLISFLLCVLLPTIAAAIYFIGFASSQYVVQWRFTIRDTNTGTSITAAASSLSGLFGGGTAASGPDNYMVTEYIKSEQAILDLEKRIGLRALYGRPSIDYFSRIDASLPIERFVRYWDYMVSASFDQITGTALAEVRAFSPEDAYLIAKTLLELTEELVNETSQRPLWEAVHYAESVVTRAQEQLKKIRIDLVEYRNKAAVIDPNSSIVLSNATVASTLRQTIAQYQTDLGASLRGGLGQNATQVEVLKRRIRATQDQLRDVEAEIAKTKEGSQPLSAIVGRYEELDLERQFAQTFLTSAMQSLEQARSNAMAKRLFVVPYVRPVEPQSSTYPKRVIAIATVAGACLLLWTVALLLWRAIREHLA